MATTRELIDDFLAQRRLALVGVSRDPKDFSRGLFREFVRQGYEVIPVNPNATELDGQACFAHVQDITPPVEGALLMTPPQVTDEVVRDCADAGISRVWMHKGGGVGAVSAAAVDFCDANDIQVVAGYCPYMFLPDAGFVHRMHGWVMKLFGSYPA